MTAESRTVAPAGRVERMIYLVRGEKVLLDQGVAMLSSVLRGPRAAHADVEIMKTKPPPRKRRIGF